MNVSIGARKILLHELGLVLAGLIWGFVVPATAYPRLALAAHIQFEVNGLLYIVVSVLLLALPHRVGPKSIKAMLVAVWLTWLMVLTEVGNSWWGTIQTLPIAASQAGATGGSSWQELIVKLSHLVAGAGLTVAWLLLVVGFWVRTPEK